jgi:hypothetical protein
MALRMESGPHLSRRLAHEDVRSTAIERFNGSVVHPPGWSRQTCISVFCVRPPRAWRQSFDSSAPRTPDARAWSRTERRARSTHIS